MRYPITYSLFLVDIRRVWIKNRGQLIRCLTIEVAYPLHSVGMMYLLHVLLCLVGRIEPLWIVEPVMRGHVGGPGVFETTMIENHVHHNFQAFSVSIADELSVLLVGAEAWVDAIIVGGGISVVCALPADVVGRVVLEHWCEPQCCNAQLGEIVEVLSDTFEVAAMAQRRLRAVLDIGIHPIDMCRMVCRLCKTVGHEHV